MFMTLRKTLTMNLPSNSHCVCALRLKPRSHMTKRRDTIHYERATSGDTRDSDRWRPVGRVQRLDKVEKCLTSCK